MYIFRSLFFFSVWLVGYRVPDASNVFIVLFPRPGGQVAICLNSEVNNAYIACL